MEKSEIKGFIAKRCAKELKDGDVVNLGIGLPTLIPNYLPEGVEVIIHAELGIVSAGVAPKEGDANYDPYHVVDAGGTPSSVAYGGGFSSGTSGRSSSPATTRWRVRTPSRLRRWSSTP